ncbi:hypothetical protein VPNG_03984 [Cytospora leucostoma]|uniref:F-box domain-containing protein n=1 Tax=Cytospora leucostoma TaxID=1230097 RepID=A0A423XE25_9PEZI|nr:hypothetical protein VPNG_03984 [Cytospora leucostoma]
MEPDFTGESESTGSDGFSDDSYESDEAIRSPNAGGRAFVLSLPNELLVKIFAYIHDWQPRGHELSSDGDEIVDFRERLDIQCVRLTCRRFCDTSSHLLLDRVTVCMTPRSLQRFEAISRHPTISRGVLGVQFNLSYYDRALAQDMAAFARRIAQEVHSMVGVGQGERTLGGGRPRCDGTEDQAGSTLDEASQLFRALKNLALGQPEGPNGEDSAYQQLARAAHAYYKQSWIEQESLLRDGYVTTVASATARMPLARRFEFHHQPLMATVDKADPGPVQPHILWPFHQALEERPFQDLASNFRSFFCWLGLPFDWTEVNINETTTLPPYDLPVTLLSALSRAGARPKSVILDLPVSDHINQFRLSAEQYEDMRDLGQHIEAFGLSSETFSRSRGPGGPLSVRHTAAMRPLGTFLGALLHTDRLKSLGMQMACTGYHTVQWSLRDLVPIRPLPYPRDIVLRKVPCHLSDLRVLFSCLQYPIHIELDEVELLTGTWAEVLDMLHGKGKEGSFCMWSTGGESRAVGHELWEHIFGSYLDLDTLVQGINPGTECILGLRPNPLRRHDGSLIVDLNDPEGDSSQDEEVSDEG